MILMSYGVVETKPSDRLEVRSCHSCGNREAVYSGILVSVSVDA